MHNNIHQVTGGGSYTESKGSQFAKLKRFSIAKITILWRVLKFKRDYGFPISAAYALSSIASIWYLNKLSLKMWRSNTLSHPIVINMWPGIRMTHSVAYYNLIITKLN